MGELGAEQWSARRDGKRANERGREIETSAAGPFRGAFVPAALFSREARPPPREGSFRLTRSFGQLYRSLGPEQQVHLGGKTPALQAFYLRSMETRGTSAISRVAPVEYGMGEYRRSGAFEFRVLEILCDGANNGSK